MGGLLKHVGIIEWGAYEICGPCVDIMAGAVVPDDGSWQRLLQPPLVRHQRASHQPDYREAAQAAFEREASGRPA